MNEKNIVNVFSTLKYCTGHCLTLTGTCRLVLVFLSSFSGLFFSGVSNGEETQKAEFSVIDQNDNQVVQLKEFLEAIPQADRPARRILFYQLDTDADGWLTADEHKIKNPELKPDAPYSRFQKADLNENQTLELDEFQKLSAEKKKDAAEKEFSDRDLNQNQTLEFDEFLFTLQAGLPTDSYFRRLDVNRNQSLSRSEFVGQYEPQLRQRNYLNFYRCDLDDNQLLTLKEFVQNGAGGEVSLLDKYRARDMNENGSLTREEYYTPNIGGKWEKAARDQAKKFDLDNNGSLSLLEFSLSPQGVFPSRELFPLLDTSNDQKISLEEFLSVRPKSTWRGFVGTFFKADTNQDGHLSTKEFLVPGVGVAEKSFVEYVLRLPAKIAFELIDKDGDGQLQLTEMTPALSPALSLESESDLAAIIAWKERRFSALLSLKELDTSEDQQLSLVEFLVAPEPITVAAMGLTKDLSLTATAKWKARDLNEDGRLSADEYKRPFLGGKWEKASALQSVQYDFDGDGRLSLLEFSLSPQGVFPSRELFPLLDRNQDGGVDLVEYLKTRPASEWTKYLSVFSNADTDQDELLSLNEFLNSTMIVADKKATVAAISLPANVKFAMFDKNNDEKLQFDELALRTRKDLMDYSSKIWWRELRFGAQQLVKESDLDGDQALSFAELAPHREHLFGVLLGDRREIPLSATAKFLARDMDRDGKLSPFEYTCTNLGTKWEAAAKDQAVLYDLDGDAHLSLLEFAITPQGAFPSRELFLLIDSNADHSIDLAEFLKIRPRNEWNYFGSRFLRSDLDDNQSLSALEFANSDLGKPDKSGQFSLTRVEPQLMFRLLDQSQDQALSLEEVIVSKKPGLDDPQALIRWEEHAMKIEEVFLASDTNQDRQLSQKEFRGSADLLASVMQGKSTSRGNSAFANNDQQQDWPWRFIGLIAVNMVLLGGFSWMLLRTVSATS